MGWTWVWSRRQVTCLPEVYRNQMIGLIEPEPLFYFLLSSVLMEPWNFAWTEPPVVWGRRPGKPNGGWKGRRAETGAKPNQTVQDKWGGGSQDAFCKNCLHSWSQAPSGKEHPSSGPWELPLEPPQARTRGPPAPTGLFCLHPSYCSCVTPPLEGVALGGRIWA